MQVKSRRSTDEVAMLTIFLIIAYDQEKSKTTTRARISQATLRIISERKRLHHGFIDDWIDAMADFGWSVFPVADHFAVIQTDTVDGWVRIGTKRIRPMLQRLSIGDDTALEEVARAVVRRAPPEETDD
jgi:hypothetical protein